MNESEYSEPIYISNLCGEEDSFWDWRITWNSNNSSPKLTPCFRKCVLRILIPQILFFFACLPFDVYGLSKSRDRGIERSLLGSLKDILAVGSIILTVYDFAYAIFESTNTEPVIYIESAFRILIYITVLILNITYRVKGLRTSGFLWRFFFISSIMVSLDLYFTIIGKGDSRVIIPLSVQVGLIVIQLICHCWVEPPPKYAECVRLVGVEKSEKISPDVNCSYPSNMTFSWMDKLMWSGFRRTIVIEDLWEFIPSVHTAIVNPHFLKYWNKSYIRAITKFQRSKEETTNEKKNSDSRVKLNIFPCLVRAYWPLFLKGAGAKFFHDVLLISSTLILKYLIKFVDSPRIEQPLWKGLFLAIVLFINKLLTTVFITRYFFNMMSIGMKIKTSLTSVIYRKSLKMPSTREEVTTGEIVNLMSVDVQKIVDLMPLINTVWSGPFQIFAAIYLLCDTLGPSALAGVFVMILLVPINGVIAIKMKNAHLEQMKHKDHRVKKMNEILQGMKIIKLYGWELSFSKLISNIRIQEVQILKREAKYYSYMMMLMFGAPFLISLATFVVYILSDPENHVLDSEKVFVSISLFNILRFPLSMLTHVIGGITQASVSLKRLNRFLASEELDEKNVRKSQNENQNMAIIINENSSFSWDKDTAPLLKNVSFSVPKGSLVVIVGPVGCGKSSLMSAILGEMQVQPSSSSERRVQIDGTVAYTPQQPWMQNSSIRDNILFGRRLNQEWYEKVIKACALEADLDILPSRDQTEIGEKGINLSGGQKQRISLARAVYSQSSVYILDDPLSAVDPHVGQHLLKNVIGGSGLLSGKTRLLVTHNTSCLPQADNIIVLKDGCINESGTYNELIQKKGPFAEILKTYSNLALKNNDEDTTTSHETVETNKQSKDLNVSTLKQYKDETVMSGGVSRQAYWYFLSRVGIVPAILIMAGLIVSQMSSVGANVWLSVWSDAKAQNTTEQIYYAGTYTGIGLSQIFIGVTCTYTINIIILNISRTLHDLMLKSILRSPMTFFDTTPLGRILNRFGQDIDTLDTKMMMCIFGSISGTLSYISTIIIVGMNVPIFFIPIIFILSIYFFVLSVSVSTSRQLKRLKSVAASPIYSHFTETIVGISTIRAYSLEKSFNLEFERRLNEYQRREFPSTMANRWLAVRVHLVGNTIVFAAAMFSVLARDNISSGEMGLNISTSLAITSILNWVIQMYSDVENNIVSVERIKEYSEKPSEAPWDLDSDSSLPSDWPKKGEIRIENLTIRYRPELEQVLKSISINVSHGERVGIVGRTGSGKSTLVLALFRLLESENGSFLIDGVDIKKIGLHKLRHRLTIIPQDPVLFSGTLRQNLDPFESFTEKDLVEVLRQSHLSSFLSEEGLDKVIAENGENISVGQRQLVCLARALLRKSRILVLDEATAAVDSQTDSLIQETIKHNFKDSTVITIAHRIQTILDYSKILVLDEGNALEFDTPKNLMNQESSMFHGMCKVAGIM